MQSAAKVGLLLVVFIGLLIGGYAVLGRNLFNDTVDYYADFADAAGVQTGSPVQIAGVDVGSVAKVALLDPRHARLTLRLKKNVVVPVGSTAAIPSSLIGLGQMTVLIAPPPQPEGGALPPGAIIQGEKTSPLDAVLPSAKQTLNEMTKTLVSVRKLLDNQKMQDRLVTLLQTSNQTVDRVGRLVDNANLVLAQNQGAIHQALLQGSQAVADVRRVTYQVAKLAESGKLQSRAAGIMDDMRATLQRTDKLIASMDQLVNDPKLRQPIDRTAANVAEITETGKEIAENTRVMTKNGTVITQNAIALTAQATEVARKASEIEDQLKGVLDKVGGFFGKKPAGGGLSNLQAEMDLIRESRPGHWRTDIDFRLPLPDSALHFGLYDTFESNKLTVQLEKPLNPKLDYRYGVYASKPSAGVDYALSPKVSLRGDLWDINDLKLDLRARYDLGNDLVGWIGVQRLFKDNAAVIGIGVRR